MELNQWIEGASEHFATDKIEKCNPFFSYFLYSILTAAVPLREIVAPLVHVITALL